MAHALVDTLVDLHTGDPSTVGLGDYRQDNVLVDDSDRVTAVPDWEMATLGDPLTDPAMLVTDRISALSRAAGAGVLRARDDPRGIHFRYTHGQTVGDGFERIGDVVGPLVAAGLRIFDEPRMLFDER